MLNTKNTPDEITDPAELRRRLKSVKSELKALDTILNEAYEGIVVVDKNGYITKFNQAYEKFLGLKEEEVKGEFVADVIENTRMHLIVQNGEKEIGHIQRIQGNDMICHRLPIFDDDGETILGGVGVVIFKDVKELKSLNRRMEVLEEKLNKHKGELKRLQEAKYSFDNILTVNSRMNYLKKIAKRAAENNSAVLLEGATGTGKELFAHAIHKASYRKFGRFIRVNCAAIPSDLLESELFGYEEGAFTGASKEGKPGKFELANGGTIFLDEISSLPLKMQAKLLRVLQEKEFTRVGGTETIDLDVRVIAASNESLETKIKNNNFRKDLYYRLNVIRLKLPLLKERKDDIPLLARKKLKDLISEFEIEELEFASETLDYLKAYDWPGNIRELFNVIERTINFVEGRVIQPEHLPPIISEQAKPGEQVSLNNQDFQFGETLNLKDNVARLEKESIKKALERTGCNKSKAARLLGIHRTNLYDKLEKYDLNCD